MRKSITLAGLLLSLIITSLLPAAASAAGSGSSLTTTPVSSVLHATPGHSVSTTISVENNSLEAYKVTLQLQTFRPYGTNGQAQIEKPKPDSDYVSWVHFSQTSFVAQPEVWQKITMTVGPPSTAGLEYYYAVLVKPTPLSSSKKEVGLNGYNAILVLLDVESPNAKAQLSVSSFSSSHRLYEYLPATFNIGVRNTGNVFLAPEGDVFISRTNNFSHPIDIVPINAGQGNVIPSSSRVFSQQWADGFPVFKQETVDGQPLTGSDGTPIEHLSWNFTDANKLRIGKYYAKMVFVYNNGTADIPTSAVISFWVIPWKVLSVLFIVIILCMVGLYVSGHKLADRTYKTFKPVHKDRLP
jgi:hypothetical protein